MFADQLDPATCVLSGHQVEVIRARLLRAIIAIDPEHARRRFTRAVRDREVISYLDRDGTVTISGQGLSPDEAAATERLRALAKAVKRAGTPVGLPRSRPTCSAAGQR